MTWTPSCLSRTALIRSWCATSSADGVVTTASFPTWEQSRRRNVRAVTTTDRQPVPDRGRPRGLAWWARRPFARSFLLLWAAGAIITFFGMVVLESESTTAIGNDFFYAAWLVVLAYPVWALAKYLERRRASRRASSRATRRR